MLPEARRRSSMLGLRGITYIEPEYDVAIGWVARAAGVLFIPGRVDDDRVVEGAYCFKFGVLAFYFICFVNLPQEKSDRNVTVARVEWRRCLLPPFFLNTLESPHSVSGRSLSYFSLSTPSLPSPSSSLPSSTSRKGDTSRRPHSLSKSSYHTRTK